MRLPVPVRRLRVSVCLSVCASPTVCREPQWTDDEGICARAVTNEVHFYDGRNLKDGMRGQLIVPVCSCRTRHPDSGECLAFRDTYQPSAVTSSTGAPTTSRPVSCLPPSDGHSRSAGVTTRAILKNVAHFQLAPGSGACKFAAFIPGLKVGRLI